MRFWFFWVIAGFFEIPFLFLIFEKPIAPVFLFFHLVAVFLLFFSSSSQKREAFFIFIFFFPLLGWALAPILFLISNNPPHIQGFSVEEEVPFFAGSEILLAPTAQKTSRQERVLKELDFIPLADILEGDDDDLKRGAIEKLALLKTPEAIDFLLIHRSDVSAEIRFYVTSALTRIKKEFDEELEAAKQEMQKDIYNIPAHVALAKIYLQYAASHLLDPYTVKNYEEEVIFHLSSVIKNDQAPAEAYWMLIDLYTSRANWKEALSAIHALEKKKDVSKQDVEQAKAKILYRMHDFEGLKHQLEGMKKQDLFDTTWASLAYWWGVS